MGSVSLQKQPELFARGMKEYGLRLLAAFENDPSFKLSCDLMWALRERPKYVAAIWRAWGGPK